MTTPVDTSRPPPSFFTEPEDFEKALTRGELLFFDSMRFFSHLIKVADNRPINHCAVYLGDGDVAHCSTPLDGDPDHCVFVEPLSHLMKLHRMRTVTAMRHVSIDSEQSAVVVERARAFADGIARYAYVDLTRLAAPCLLRAYQGELAGKKASVIINVLGDAANVGKMHEWFRHFLAALGTSGTPKPEVMTCSSFAYRCYLDNTIGPSFDVRIDSPLATLKNGIALGTWPDLNEFDNFLRVIDFISRNLKFDPALEEPSSTEIETPKYGDDVAVQVLGISETVASVRQAARLVASFMVWISRLPGVEIPLGVVDADVTLRDLWGSKSFRPVAVFHRAPGGPDDDRKINVPLPSLDRP